jgi:RimJ/RimL family protein N-acetyltransferase
MPLEIKGLKVTLRPIGDKEIPQACAWRNDPEVAHLFYRQNVTPEQMARDVQTLRQTQTGDTLAIISNNSAEHVGTLTYTIARKQGAAAEATLGIIIGPRHTRGRGLGGDAMDALGKWLAAHHGVGKLLVEVKPGNQSALGFYEKTGFTQRAIIMERNI